MKKVKKHNNFYNYSDTVVIALYKLHKIRVKTKT